MPTPLGKPIVGEHILTRDGVLGKVVRRGTGDSYSVWVRWPPRAGFPRVTIITEFEFHAKRQGWRVVR